MGAYRQNGILMPLLLLVAEAIILDGFECSGGSSNYKSLAGN